MMAPLTDIELLNQKVLVRCDFNVPIADGKIVDDTRIIKALPTIEYLIKQGAITILMSHLGRPKPGERHDDFSLASVAQRLTALLHTDVVLVEDMEAFAQSTPLAGQVFLLENVRFNPGETENDAALSEQYARLADVFVFDAFGSAHRAHASTVGVAAHFPSRALGFLMAEELRNLVELTDHPKRPLTAIIGGSKISTKLALLKNLLYKVDRLIIGGGMANTFLQAKGVNIGASLTEASLLEQAKDILKFAEAKNVTIGLPEDVVTVKTFSADAPTTIKSLDDIDDDDMIIDIGPNTQQHYAALIAGVKTVLWNGPVGVCEWPSGCQGTLALGKDIAASQAYTVAGGGDTVAFIHAHHLENAIDYISTGGGAFLFFLEGKLLPAIDAMLQS